MKKIAIIQSSYIPWKGYFDLINSVDECVIYDDVQFTKRDWRSRNMIRTVSGVQWLSIPVLSKKKFYQKINEVKTLDTRWASKHWNAIVHNYSKAPYFSKYKQKFKQAYSEVSKLDNLSEINIFFIRFICDILGIKTKFSFSNEYGFAELKQTERLITLCKAACATHYLSGPAAKDYIDTEAFVRAEIMLEYISYSGYSEYKQNYTDFIPNVSIFDLIFNVGGDYKNFMKSF